MYEKNCIFVIKSRNQVMNIVIVGPAHPYRGGIAKFNETLALRMAKEGHDVKIVSFSLQYPQFLFPGSTQYTDAPAPALEIDRMLNSVNPLNWGKVARKIVKMKPDLVMFRYWMPFFGPSMGTIAKVLKNKKIHTVALTDNIVPHEKHFYDKICNNYFLNSINKVVYMSDEVGRDLDNLKFKGTKAFSPHPIYDTYGQGVTKDEACSVLELDSDTKYVLFFGFIRDYKGLDLLLKAWREVSVEIKGQSGSKIKLLIAGEFYDEKQPYIDLIEELGIGSEVVLRDCYIAEDDVKYYFSAADLVVQPYRNATQSGITQVAYSFGVPMIVTNVGGLAEIVPNEKVGFVVEPNSCAIAMSIERYFEQNLHDKFSENIKTEKDRFSWREMIAAIVKQ